MTQWLCRSGILFTVVVFGWAPSNFSQGGPLRVLASNGVRAALQDLVPQWERAVGRPLMVEFDPSAAIKRKIEGNAPFDGDQQRLPDAVERSGGASQPADRCGESAAVANERAAHGSGGRAR